MKNLIRDIIGGPPGGPPIVLLIYKCKSLKQQHLRATATTTAAILSSSSSRSWGAMQKAKLKGFLYRRDNTIKMQRLYKALMRASGTMI